MAPLRQPRRPRWPLPTEEAAVACPGSLRVGARRNGLPQTQDETVSLGRLYQLYKMEELKSDVKVWRVEGGDRWLNLGNELDAALAEQGEP